MNDPGLQQVWSGVQETQGQFEKLVEDFGTLYRMYQALASKMEADVATLKGTIQMIITDRNELVAELATIQHDHKQLKQVVLATNKAEFAGFKVRAAVQAAEMAGASRPPVPSAPTPRPRPSMGHSVPAAEQVVDGVVAATRVPAAAAQAAPHVATSLSPAEADVFFAGADED